MKRILMCILAIGVVFGLCSCGSPVECSIIEMNCMLPSGYTMEEDQEIANQNLDDTFVTDAFEFDVSDIISDNDTLPAPEKPEKMRAKDYLAVQWYDGDDNDIAVTAMECFFNNDELKDAIDAIGLLEEDYEYVDIDGATVAYGTDYVASGSYMDSNVSSSTNTEFFTLKNGILYEIMFYNEDDMSESDIDNLINSISFTETDLEPKTVTSGDFEMTLSGYWHELDTGDTADGFNDKKAMGIYGDGCQEFTISYLDANKYSMSKMIDYCKSMIDNLDYSEMSESFGKCYYFVGDYEGDSTAIGLFESGNKIYMIEMYSLGKDIETADMQEIMSTLKKK